MNQDDDNGLIHESMWPYLRAFLKHPEEAALNVKVTGGKVRAVLLAHPADLGALTVTTIESGLKQAFTLLCKAISGTDGHFFRLNAITDAVLNRSTRSLPRGRKGPQAAKITARPSKAPKAVKAARAAKAQDAPKARKASSRAAKAVKAPSAAKARSAPKARKAASARKAPKATRAAKARKAPRRGG